MVFSVVLGVFFLVPVAVARCATFTSTKTTPRSTKPTPRTTKTKQNKKKNTLFSSDPASQGHLRMCGNYDFDRKKLASEMLNHIEEVVS